MKPSGILSGSLGTGVHLQMSPLFPLYSYRRLGPDDAHRSLVRVSDRTVPLTAPDWVDPACSIFHALVRTRNPYRQFRISAVPSSYFQSAAPRIQASAVDPPVGRMVDGTAGRFRTAARFHADKAGFRPDRAGGGGGGGGPPPKKFFFGAPPMLAAIIVQLSMQEVAGLMPLAIDRDAVATLEIDVIYSGRSGASSGLLRPRIDNSRELLPTDFEHFAFRGRVQHCWIARKRAILFRACSWEGGGYRNLMFLGKFDQPGAAGQIHSRQGAIIFTRDRGIIAQFKAESGHLALAGRAIALTRPLRPLGNFRLALETAPTIEVRAGYRPSYSGIWRHHRKTEILDEFFAQNRRWKICPV